MAGELAEWSNAAVLPPPMARSRKMREKRQLVPQHFSLKTKQHFGSVAEWLKATVLKTVIPEMVSKVRILPLPQKN